MPGGDDVRMEFASRAWLDFFHKLLVARAAISIDPTAPPVICEVYRNVPAHIAPSGRLAWTRRIDCGALHFELKECADAEADVKLVGDYEALAPLARFFIGDNDAEAFGVLMQAAVAAGRVKIVRDQRAPDAPRDFTVHNMLAALTL